MQQAPEGSIDLIFADPPFNIGYKYDVYDDQLAADEYLKWSEDWIREAYRALKSDGSFWLAIGDDFAAELKLVAQQIGFHCRSWVIWYYTFGVNCKFKFTRSHTHLLYFVKDVENFTFNSNDLDNRIPSARMLVYNDARTNPVGRLPDDTWIIPPDVPATFALRPQDLQDCFLPNESDWYFPRVAGTFKERAGFHGCQMPEQLLGRIIRTCSDVGDVVLDPFSGSASTLLVAKKLGRRQIGFELSDEYSIAGRERLDDVQEGDDLVGAPEPKMSALPTWKKAQQENGNKVARPSKSVPKATVSVDEDAVLSLIDALGRTLPKDATLSSEVQAVVQRAVLKAFAGIADRYSLTDIDKGGRALKAFHKQCVELSVPGDADCHLDTLKHALQSHSQLF
ncbi:MAG: site-specific DNA-methyltransferase [Fuerstiella sp.]